MVRERGGEGDVRRKVRSWVGRLHREAVIRGEGLGRKEGG